MARGMLRVLKRKGERRTMTVEPIPNHPDPSPVYLVKGPNFQVEAWASDFEQAFAAGMKFAWMSGWDMDMNVPAQPLVKNSGRRLYNGNAREKP